MMIRDPYNGQQLMFDRTDRTGRYIALTVEKEPMSNVMRVFASFAICAFITLVIAVVFAIVQSNL